LTGPEAPRDGTRLGAVILAAGLGTRLGPHTDHRPKCLLDVGGLSIAERARAALAEAGAEATVFVVGYRAAQIRRAVAGPGVGFAVNDDFRTTSTAWSAAVGLRHLARTAEVDRVVLIEGDVVFDRELLRSLIEAEAPDVTLVEPWRPEIDGSTVVLGPDDRVLAWTHTADRTDRFSPGQSWKLVNLHAMSPQTAFGGLLEAAADPGHRTRSLEYVLGREGISHAGFRAVPTQGRRWVEVDDGADLERARALFGPS
jgi:choline kinase